MLNSTSQILFLNRSQFVKNKNVITSSIDAVLTYKIFNYKNKRYFVVWIYYFMEILDRQMHFREQWICLHNLIITAIINTCFQNRKREEFTSMHQHKKQGLKNLQGFATTFLSCQFACLCSTDYINAI